MALIVEAHAVDHPLVFFQPEQPRPVIAHLGKRGDRADLDETEAEAEHLIGHFAVLVEAGREPDRISKAEARHHSLQRRSPRRLRRESSAAAQLQQCYRRAMCPFCLEREGEWTNETIEGHIVPLSLRA